jgi:hypothetical protein
MERCLTGVRAVFCAAHYSPEGEDHGHDYEVWAYWPAGADARHRKAQLEAMLAEFDHKRLPEGLAWDNALAPLFGGLLAAVRIRIIRPLQGIEACWESGS